MHSLVTPLWRHGRHLALAASLLYAGQAGALEKGRPAPAFDLRGPAGQVGLAQNRGKLVYVDFWASWCGPCRLSFPWMNEMQAKYGAQGLQIIAINLDARTDDALGFLNAMPAQFMIAFDPAGAVPKSYGLKGMPSSYLIGRDGKLLFEHMGFNQNDKAELEQQIKAQLGAGK